MRTRIAMSMLAMLLMVVPAAAQEPQLFGFIGQALVPQSVGGMLTMYSVMYEPAPGTTTPLPLDFDNFEYTLVITDLELVALGSPNQYANGTLVIYEDNATAADYAAPATFTDGNALLIGTITWLTHRMQILNPLLGTVNGRVDWIGGSQIDDIAPEDQVDWPLFASVSRRAENLEPGWDEQWNGKVEPTEPIVGIEHTTWSAVKNLLR